MKCPYCHDPVVACVCRRDPVRLVDDPEAASASRAAVALLADETVDDAGDAGDAAFERVRAEVRRRLVRYVGGAT